MKTITKKRMGVTLAFCLVVIGLGWQQLATVKAAPPGVKEVICHATGSDSNPYVGVVVGVQENGQLANNGHLDENGSPYSGHEEDIRLGLSPPTEKSDCDKLPPPDPK